jgi:acyl carrier protein
MECAVMAAQMLSDFEGKSIQFQNLSFEGALGIDHSRDVSLWLESQKEELTWNFSFESFSRSDPKSRRTSHAKGKLMLVPQPDFRLYERLISGLMSSVMSDPKKENFMSGRAYSLFSRVVQYAEYLQGISHIIIAGHQAVAEVKIPQPRVSSAESTAMQICDAVSLDVFIQVVGLLINSSDQCPNDGVFIATGVDNISMLPCNFHNSEPWMVYATFTPLSDSQATGDIFVFTKRRELVITGSGIRFSQLPIPRLEKLMEIANLQASENAVAGNLKALSESPFPNYTTQDSESNNSVETKCESERSYRQVLESSTPRNVSLKSLIAAYTGLRESEIGDHAAIGELHLDPSAAVELANELQSEFGIEILSEDLLATNISSLCQRLILSPPSKNHSTIRDTVNSAGFKGEDTRNPSNQNDSIRRQKALQLISDSCGAAVDTIDAETNLQDIGFDSLSVIEFKTLLEDAFSIEIGDGDLNLQSTVKQVLEYLGIGCMSQPANEAATAVTVESSIPRTLTTGNIDHNAEVETRNTYRTIQRNDSSLTANPIEDLLQSQAVLDKSSRRLGFWNYWVDVAPREDELLLAFIYEAFMKLGVDLRKVQKGEVVPQVPYVPERTKVFRRYLEILERLHIVTRKGHEILRANGQIPDRTSGEIHQRFVKDYPQYACEANLMAITGLKLAECLNGKVDPMSLLFGNQVGQAALEDFYTNAPMFATLTEQLVAFIEHVMPNSSDTRIRIMEVGAGFGGTTKRLAEVLHELPVSVEYTFSDVSYTLVKNARSKFARYSWMNFQVFNLENDVSDTLREKYDIVLGTNCVHATADKVATINRMRQLLKPGGFILLSEITKVIDWYDIVFGLLDGWWMAKDGSYALQPADNWMRCFEAAGFHSLSYSGGSTIESRTQQLLLGCTKIPKPLANDILAAPKQSFRRKSVIYKEVDGVQIAADIYLPTTVPQKEMPIGEDH